MLYLSDLRQYYLCSSPTDMRKGFDSLCGLVSSRLQLNVLSGAVFIFINRKGNQLKLLLWEGDGFALYYKRLEKGTFELPASDGNSAVTVSARQLQFILQGVSLDKIQYRKRYKRAG